MSSLAAWANFYVIMGSSAGALTGLTFVVITLTSEARLSSLGWGVAAFTSPTIFHFGAVLFVCAVLSTPWPALWQPSLLLALSGLAGFAYAVIVVRRLRRRENYDPVAEDWLWYGIIPLVGYAVFALSAILLPGNPTPALFGIGAVMVLLIFTGIHNAWDVVTFITIQPVQPQDSANDGKATTASNEANE